MGHIFNSCHKLPEGILTIKAQGPFPSASQEEKAWKWSNLYGAQYSIEKTPFRKACCERKQAPEGHRGGGCTWGNHGKSWKYVELCGTIWKYMEV